MNRTYNRNYRTRSCPPAFVIATEGNVTEPEYFEIIKKFKRRDVSIKVVHKETNSSPNDVLKVLKKAIKEHQLEDNDEAWMVIDRDDWPQKQIESVLVSLRKIRTKCKCFLVMTNPKIEFWILLHFEEGNGVNTAFDCDRRLKKYIPNYDKHVKNVKLDIDCIKKAIERARKLDVEHCEWPQTKGSTLYRLVEKIFP